MKTKAKQYKNLHRLAFIKTEKFSSGPHNLLKFKM